MHTPRPITRRPSRLGLVLALVVVAAYLAVSIYQAADARAVERRTLPTVHPACSHTYRGHQLHARTLPTVHPACSHTYRGHQLHARTLPTVHPACSTSTRGHAL